MSLVCTNLCMPYTLKLSSWHISPSFPCTSKTKHRTCSHFQDDLFLLGAGRYLHAVNYTYFVVMNVTFPDPAPKREKGLVYIKRFLHTICLTCDYHVTPCYSRLLLSVRVWERESGWCIAMSKRCIVMTITWHPILCTPKSTRCIPDPFPPWGWGLGTRLVFKRTQDLSAYWKISTFFLVLVLGNRCTSHLDSLEPYHI